MINFFKNNLGGKNIGKKASVSISVLFLVFATFVVVTIALFTFNTVKLNLNQGINGLDILDETQTQEILIDFYIKQGYKGVVIEATGLGHVAAEGKNSWLKVIKKAIKGGIIVCFAPQCLYGSLNPFVYATARKLQDIGVLFLKDMLPETAYIKLSWLLGKEKNKENVKKLMLQNLVGEFNPRLSVGDFLI